MDSWRGRPKQERSIAGEDSLLPPSLRRRNRAADDQQQQQQPPARDRNGRRAAKGFLGRVSAILEAQASAPSSSSSSAEDPWTEKKPLGRELAGGRPESAELLHANMELLEVRLSSKAEVPLSGPRRAAVKARVEARRVEQLRGDSSLDESGRDPERRTPQLAPGANKRSRASRTERYLKRMCNGGKSLVGLERAPEDLGARLSEHDDITDDNFYARHTLVGVNPLVQRTLRCFSELDRGLPAMAHDRPPTPPSRDHTSRVLADKYRGFGTRSPEARLAPAPLRRQPQRPRRVLVAAHPLAASPSPRSSKTPEEQRVEPTASIAQRRSSKNLEEALCELEAIYQSLQLGDEELLDRAERRTMEEFLYKGLTSSPDSRDGALLDRPPSASPRKSWLADPSLDEQPDRLRDDMAYRRMHPRERPTSADVQSLSGISYLMACPVPCRARRDAPPFADPTRSSARRREPDVALDDVAFRNMHHAQNTLKVVEPQPPFGIPLGPITAAADSDYLHSNPGDSQDRPRRQQPDLVTDDLAFRSLRKDTQPGSRQSSPCLFPPSTPPLAVPRPCWRDGRAAAPLRGSTSKPASPAAGEEPLEDSCAVGRPLARRISEPEATRASWRGLQAASGRGQEHGDRPRRQTDPSDGSSSCSSSSSSSSSSCVESSDASIRPVCAPVADDDHPRATSSSSSICADPAAPPPTRSLEPFTAHELSVYKQLCRDLENLVQLTQTDDSAPLPSAGRSLVEQSVSSTPRTGEGPAASSCPAAAPWAGVGFEAVPATSASESSPTRLEISSILDSLKSLREDSQPGAAGAVGSTAQWEPSPSERAKEDGGGGDGQGEQSSEDEEEKDQVDEKQLFLRSVQLAKLSGDWKESTPNSLLANRRRTSLASDDKSHWEGVNKCNHKYNSMPAKTSSLLMFRQYGSKRKSKNRKSICTIS